MFKPNNINLEILDNENLNIAKEHAFQYIKSLTTSKIEKCETIRATSKSQVFFFTDEENKVTVIKRHANRINFARELFAYHLLEKNENIPKVIDYCDANLIFAFQKYEPMFDLFDEKKILEISAILGNMHGCALNTADHLYGSCIHPKSTIDFTAGMTASSDTVKFREICQFASQKGGDISIGDINIGHILTDNKRIFFCDLETVQLGLPAPFDIMMLSNLLSPKIDFRDIIKSVIFNYVRARNNIRENEEWNENTLSDAMNYFISIVE